MSTAPSERARALERLRGASDFLARMLSRRPSLARWLLHGRGIDRHQPRLQFLEQAGRCAARAASGDLPGLERCLRRYKYRQLARIAYRDAGLDAPLLELGDELSSLAEALIQAALHHVTAEVDRLHGPPEDRAFLVLALGKLGGEDLNFSSDIDLLYVYRGEGQTAGGEREAISHTQYFTKLATLLTRVLSNTTADGFLFRVDLNLRPEGRSGALVTSLPALSHYYETLGRTWERSALIKARRVAGDASLAEQVTEAIRPFVWRRSLDLSAVDALRDIKAQIDLRSRANVDDVKLGRGGIREVEFFVNALQLLHGGKEPAFRDRHTMRALRKLERAGHVPGPVADELEEAYLFLRRVENHLQMREERQTQTLPAEIEELSQLAQTLGFADANAFSKELGRLRAQVHYSFSTLLGQVARDALPEEPLLAVALDPGAADEQRKEALAQRGFVDPVAALVALDRLAALRDSPFGAGGAPGVQALQLLSEVASTPDPDQALFCLAEFLSRARAPLGYLALLGRWPAIRRRLLNLFGQSEYLARSFLRSPELLDVMWDASFETSQKSPTDIRAEIIRRAQRAPPGEERLAVLRRVKNEEVLRIGVADLANELTVPQVAQQLTAVAEVSLEECLALAQLELQERYGAPASPSLSGLAVLGLGKLGGGELGYHSDLDLLFVYPSSGPSLEPGSDETTGGTRGRLTAHEYYAKLVQRFLAFLQMQLREGRLYEIDARLRPSGNQGTLVVSERAFRAHHETRAQLWERQALIKARGVASDLAFGESICRNIRDPLVYERPLPANAAEEIARLRRRMELELSGESDEGYNPKTGRGGLVDVEFAVQYLQLVHGATHPAVRTANTLEALAALEVVQGLPRADAATLRDGYLFLRRTETRLRVVHGQGIDQLPTQGRSLATLARRLGYLGPDAGPRLLEEYRTRREAVRTVYNRVLGIRA